MNSYYWIIIIIFFGTIVSYYSYYIYRSFVLIHKIEDKYKSKFIFIRDTNKTVIDKILMYIYKNYVISINDNNSLRKILLMNNNKNIIMLIESVGGYISSSDSMLNLLNRHKPIKHAYIPIYALSAATLLALSCDKIYMDKCAVFGPTDPQIMVFNEMIGFKTVLQIIENKSINKISDKLLIAYYECKKLYDDNVKQIKQCINKHKKKNISDNDVEEIVKTFTLGNLPHCNEIVLNDLTKVLNINNTIPAHILTIYSLLKYIFKII